MQRKKKSVSVFPEKPAANYAKKEKYVEKPILLGLTKTEWMTLSVVCSSLHMICKSAHLIPELDTYPAASPYKPISTWNEFYPFYLEQHSDLTCRRLHIIGTTIGVTLMILNPKIVISIIPAVQVGYIVMILTRFQNTGAFEMLSIFGTFLLTTKFVKGSMIKAISMMLIGYSFAWVGHFWFELNKPATFTYPLWSLAGDCKLWAEVALLGKRTF